MGTLPSTSDGEHVAEAKTRNVCRAWAPCRPDENPDGSGHANDRDGGGKLANRPQNWIGGAILVPNRDAFRETVIRDVDQVVIKFLLVGTLFVSALVQKMVLGLLGFGIGPGTQLHDPGGASMMTLPLASAGTTDRLPSTRLKE